MADDYTVPMECLRQCAAELGEDGAGHLAVIRDLELLERMRAHAGYVLFIDHLHSEEERCERLGLPEDAEFARLVRQLLSPGDAGRGEGT